MIATLMAIVCLVTSPKACITVEVERLETDPPITFGSCMGHEGANIARTFVEQKFRADKWAFGGWRCRVGTKAMPERSA